MVDYSDLMDKPFRLGARGPDAYDCWGLCLEVGRRAGIEYPAVFTPPSTAEQSAAIARTRDAEFEPIERPEPWCIAAFYATPPFVDHCGIVLPDRRRFLHITAGGRVRRSRLDSQWATQRLAGFYRLRGDACR